MIITKRRQMQAIRDYISTGELLLDPDYLDDDCYYLYEYITDYRRFAKDEYEINQYLYRLQKTNDDLAGLIGDILDLEPGYRQQHLTLAQIGPDLPNVDWLWTNWLPRGMLSLLASDPGTGKTYVALDLARRIIHDLAAPDETLLNLRTRNIVYIDAEDFLNVIYDRLSAWDANLRRFYPFRRPEREMIDLAGREHQDILLDMCYDLHPDLVVVDSLSSVNLKSENNIEDLRGILSFLVEIAQDYNCAVLLIHHLRKPQNNGNSQVSMHDLRGSGHIVAMARSILGMWNPGLDPNGPRRLQVIKTNLCRYPTPMVVHYSQSPANPEVATIAYDQLAAPSLPENLTGECAEWLEETLVNGPMSYAELKELADEAGFKENTLQNARKALDWKIVDTVGAGRKGNKWALHDQIFLTDESDASQLRHESHMVTWPCNTPPPSKNSPPPLLHGHVSHVITSTDENDLIKNNKNHSGGTNGHHKSSLAAGYSGCGADLRGGIIRSHYPGLIPGYQRTPPGRGSLGYPPPGLSYLRREANASGGYAGYPPARQAALGHCQPGRPPAVPGNYGLIRSANGRHR